MQEGIVQGIQCVGRYLYERLFARERHEYCSALEAKKHVLTSCAGTSSGGGLGLLVSHIRKDRKILNEMRKERVIHELP